MTSIKKGLVIKSLFIGLLVYTITLFVFQSYIGFGTRGGEKLYGIPIPLDLKMSGLLIAVLINWIFWSIIILVRVAVFTRLLKNKRFRKSNF
jgi:hypothetical protein